MQTMRSMTAESMIRQTNELVWNYDRGIGYCHPGNGHPYNKNYFLEYKQRSETEIGVKLMDVRCKLVARFYGGRLCDFGAGFGAFVEARNKFYKHETTGYDINPFTAHRLIQHGIFADPYAEDFNALSFWDVLEHLPDPANAVRLSSGWVFISIPIFEGPQDCRVSKHFKPGEHLWYFTSNGLVKFMERCGFDLAEINNEETLAGREGILSYAFRRRDREY